MQAYEVFEQEWGKWAGLREGNVVACNSGTSALVLALEALQLPLGSEVITGDYNMVAVARAITMAGHVPVFVDCDDNLLMDLDLTDEAGSVRGGKVKAVLPTHIYGRCIDMHQLHSLARKYGWYVVEDASESHGVPPHPDTDAYAASHYQNKVVGANEGGSIGFRKKSHADRARQLRCLGFTEAHDFNHIPRGFNGRLSNVHAQAILQTLEKVEENIKARRSIEAMYDLYCQAEWKMPPTESPWVYSIRIDSFPSGKTERVVLRLNEVGIQARFGFKPMTHQIEYQHHICFKNGNAEKAAREVFYLPLTPGSMNEERVKQAFEIIHRIVKQ